MKTIFRRWLSIIFLSPLLLLGGCNNNDNDSATVGYIYTTTNGEGENAVIRFARKEDGRLTDQIEYPTGAMGGSDADGPAGGDFDYQGGLQIIDDYLLTVNVGGNSVSVFTLDRSNGELSLVRNVSSGGDRPVSIGYTPIAGETGQYWVAVANQWGSPAVLYDGDELRRFPSDEFFQQDLSQSDETDELRNIQLYRFDTTDGTLEAVRQLDKFERKWGGPAQVSFSPDGKKMAVTLLGIAHFLTEDPQLEEMEPSRVYVYDFANGQVSNRRQYEEQGLSGAVGFDWADDNEKLYVSYFNVINDKADHGLVVLRDDGGQMAKFSNHTTGAEGDIDEACWTVLSPDRDRLYTASFATNVVTPFELDGDGNVLQSLPYEPVGEGEEEHDDLKGMFITSDNKYLYALGAFSSFTLKKYNITAEGVEFDQSFEVDATADADGRAGVYDLLGIGGFDL